MSMKNKNLLFSFLAVILGITTFINTSASVLPVKNKVQKNTHGVKQAVMYLAKIRNNQITGKLNPKDVLKARRQIEKLNYKSGSYGDITWEELGPDNFGGKTKAILFDNQDPQYKTIYAGSISGGMWKSTTSGQTWHKINISDECLNVSCITQTPDGDIYIGTGEGFDSQGATAYSGFVGHGIFKSTDGNNFTLLPNTKPVINNDTVEWSYINKLASDANGRIYAATNSGLMYSDNAGEHWSVAKFKGDSLLSGNSTDVDVASDGTVVASVNNLCYISTGDLNNFVCYSTKYNVTYDSIANPEKLPKNGIGRIEFAIAPSDPNCIYAVAAKDNSDPKLYGQLENIYRTTDKGKTWTIIGPGGSDDFNVLGSTAYINGVETIYYQGIYDNTISVFPDNPDKILVGGINMWEGEKILEQGFYNWGEISSPYSFLPNYVHEDHFTYVFSPNDSNTCFIGSGGGVFMTNDGAENFQAMNKGYNVCQFYTVTFTADGKVLGGAQDNGTLYIDGLGNTPMDAHKIFSGNGGYSAASLINPDAFVLSSENGNINRSEDQGTNFSLNFTPPSSKLFITPFLLWESFNDENSRDSVIFHADMDYPADTSVIVRSDNFDYPFYYTLSSPLSEGDSIKVKDIVQSKFFLGTEDNIYMTREIIKFSKAPVWFTISDKDNSDFEGTPQCMSYSRNANYLFVGTQEGKLYRISNIALAYDFERADVSSPSCIIATSLIKEFTDRVITSIAVDPNDDTHIAVTLGNYGNDNYIYITNNGLDSLPDFTSIQGNLPKMPIYSSLIEMGNSNLIIIGTEDGIYSSNNADGSSTVWSKENTGMGSVPVFMIKQQTINKPGMKVLNPDGNTYTYYPGITNYGHIYAATYGRGLFECTNFVGINDNDTPLFSEKHQLNIYPNPVKGNTNVSFTLSERNNVLINIYDFNGRIVKSINLNQQNSGSHKILINCDHLSTGTYLMQLITGNESLTSKFIIIK